MICQDFIPSPHLQQYIKRYHVRHFIFPNTSNIPFKPYVPRPEQTLAFYPRGHELVEYVASHKFIKRPKSMIMGQYLERTNRHLNGSEFCTFLVEFHPGVLYRITGIPFYELTNTFIDAESVFSKEVRLTSERLNSTENYQEMIKIVERFLYSLVNRIRKDAHPIDTIANILIEHPENSSILQLAKDSFLCTRQFERTFKQRMGISPKLFSRIAKVNKAFRIKYNYPCDDWLSIALACGYQDYQHLVKDFKGFSGVLPTTYFLEDTKSPERFFGYRDSSLV
jgi:AraC-like DNA-binding protein